MIVQKSKRLRKGGGADIKGDLKQGEGERNMPEKLTAGERKRALLETGKWKSDSGGKERRKRGEKPAIKKLKYYKNLIIKKAERAQI